MNKKLVYQVGNNKKLYYDARPTEYQDSGSYSSYVLVKGLIIRYEDGQTLKATLTKTEDGNKEEYFWNTDLQKHENK